MKYVKEINHLMDPHPGREWKMVEIVRYIDPDAKGRDRQRIRVGVSRALQALADCGLIVIRPPRAATGGYALYRVKPAGKKRYTRSWQSDTRSDTIAQPNLRPELQHANEH